MASPAFLSRLFGRSTPAQGIDRLRRGLFGAAAAMALPVPARAVGSAPFAGLPRAELAAMVRGLAALDGAADGSLSRDGAALLARLTEAMPEAPLLLDLHRLYPDAGEGEAWRREAAVDLDLLHRACHEARPVRFTYTDLRGAVTTRNVLPVELVHPAHGILLLGWCELREAPRKFFVHAMEDLRLGEGDFTARRPSLIRAILDEHRG